MADKPDGRKTCGARRKSTGEPCQRHPCIGQERCYLHGGATRQAKAAAVRRMAVEKARREVRKLGGQLDADPLTVLVDSVREAWWNVAAYRVAIEGLDITVSNDGAVAIPQSFDDKGGRDPALAHILVDLYNQERDRAVRYAKIAVDAGVEERLVRVQEAQAAEAWNAVVAALDAAGLSDDQRTAFSRKFAATIRST